MTGPAGRLPGARRLLITADSGGSNGSRLRLWKTELAAFAAEAGLDITVLHLPPEPASGTNRAPLFSAITMNWRGLPLVSHEVIIETISAHHHRLPSAVLTIYPTLPTDFGPTSSATSSTLYTSRTRPDHARSPREQSGCHR